MKLTDREITGALRAGKRVKRKSAKPSYYLNENSLVCYGRFIQCPITIQELESDDWEVVSEN